MNKILLQLRYTFGTFFALVIQLIQAPFSREARYKLSETYDVLHYPFPSTKRVSLNQLLYHEDLRLEMASVKANPHNVTEFELLAICSLIKDRNASMIFEIGTYDGRTTRAMAMNIGNSGHIFTLNLPPDMDFVKTGTVNVDEQLAHKVVSGERFINTTQQSLITQLFGNSATFDFLPYHQKMDVIFIDGAHSEEYVENDTIQAMKLLKSDGGMIIWHDAHLFGVANYLRKLVFIKKVDLCFIKGTSIAITEVRNGQFTVILT